MQYAALCLLLFLAAPDPPKPITILQAHLHQFEDGPPLTAKHQFYPGDPVFISWRLASYSKTEADKPRVKLTWKVDVIDAEKRPLVESKTGAFDVELAPQDKEWMPKARHDFVLPPLLEPGAYTVIITAKDELANTSATKELPFNVEGPRIEKSDTLVARNFRFLRSEQDTKALQTPAYRPGDSVWARFEMTGYKLGPKNEYAVAYGLEVLRPNGERVYEEPNAATEKDKTFYPKRYVPGVLNLNLNKDLAKGDYTIILRLRDEVGNQKAESKHVFTVE